MADYYSQRLSGDRLRAVYALAPPRVRRYLEAELAFAMEHVAPNRDVLELGCGYGRILNSLANKARVVVGIDTSAESLQEASRVQAHSANIFLARMDAADLALADGSFDVVLCIQNGISAFHRDMRKLFAEACRVTTKGGSVVFSSYASSFWPDRLDWFKRQSDAGLLGPIDYEKTHDGVIVCKDGFTANTVNREQFEKLASEFDAEWSITEVDSSSLFCVLQRSSRLRTPPNPHGTP